MGRRRIERKRRREKEEIAATLTRKRNVRKTRK